MRMRRYDENILREEFQKKGGMIIGDVDDVILNTVGGEYIRCSVRQFGHIARITVISEQITKYDI